MITESQFTRLCMWKVCLLTSGISNSQKVVENIKLPISVVSIQTLPRKRLEKLFLAKKLIKNFSLFLLSLSYSCSGHSTWAQIHLQFVKWNLLYRIFARDVYCTLFQFWDSGQPFKVPITKVFILSYENLCENFFQFEKNSGFKWFFFFLKT